MKKWICFSIVGLICLLCVLSIVKGYVLKNIDFSDDINIGKGIFISVTDDIYVDSQYLQSVIDLKISDKMGFLLFDEGELQKLINYMDKRNLYIQPGNYKVNQTCKFEELINIFNFVSSKQSEAE